MSKGKHIKRSFVSSLIVLLMPLCIGNIACSASPEGSPYVIKNDAVALKSADGKLQVYSVEGESERLLGSIEVDINAENWATLVAPKALASSDENPEGGKVLRYDCKGKAGKESEVICRITPHEDQVKLKYEVVYDGKTEPAKSRIMFRFAGEDSAPRIQGSADCSDFIYDNFTLELAHPPKDFGWKGGKRGNYHQMNIKNIDDFTLNVGITRGKTVTFWDYGGEDPEKGNPMGKNIEDAFRNHNMGVNNHWNTAQPQKRGEEAAWSIWKVTPESSSHKINTLTVSSELTAKKGEASGKFATVQWSLDPEGPWKSVYSHSFPGNTDSWMRKGNEGDIDLDEPASAVYLRMKFPPRGRDLMWWDWKVVGRTVGADK